MKAGRHWPFGLAAAAGFATVASGTSPDGAGAGVLRPDDPEVLEAGSDLYMKHCASCHGADLEGQPDWRSRGPDGLLPAPPHDETGHTWHHTDQVLFDLTKYGLAAFVGPDYDSAMPAFDGVLSDAEIVAVLSFIKSRWPERIRQRHDEMNALEQE
jgi:mono/diheme cytochrome c family protein